MLNMGIIGLGKMGANMARRLAQGNHYVVGYTRRLDQARELAEEHENITSATSLKDLVAKLSPPRLVWCMLPAGQPTEQVIDSLLELLEPDDVIIDGGNSNYSDSQRRADKVAAREMHFLDVGTSGGIWGLKEGYSMMVGGDASIVARLRPIFETLAPAPDRGWDHVGPSGSGHFVKMVHNGIEYGMMQAYAEGFDILKSKKEFHLDLQRIAELWRFGSVIRSWLLDLTASALAQDQELKDIEAWVADSGEGRWTVFEAINQDTPAPVITLSLIMRLVSRQENSYAAKLLATMRNQFGGHSIKHEG